MIDRNVSAEENVRELLWSAGIRLTLDLSAPALEFREQLLALARHERTYLPDAVRAENWLRRVQPVQLGQRLGRNPLEGT